MGTSKVSRMEGTSGYIEYLKNNADHDTRHRSRCIYFESRATQKCGMYNEKCHGSSHCPYYEERRINSETSHTNSYKAKKSVVVGTRKLILPFEGVKKLSIDDISISYSHAHSKIKDSWINKTIEQSKERGYLNPIVVECEKDQYILTDNYLSFVAAKKLKQSYVYAEMGTKEELQMIHRIRQIGTIVFLRDMQDDGEVIDADLFKATIRMDSRRIVEIDICEAVKKGRIVAY